MTPGLAPLAGSPCLSTGARATGWQRPRGASCPDHSDLRREAVRRPVPPVPRLGPGSLGRASEPPAWVRVILAASRVGQAPSITAEVPAVARHDDGSGRRSHARTTPTPPDAPESRHAVTFLSVALLAIGFVVSCTVALRRSRRRDWIALVLVGLGGRWPAPTPARAASSRRPHRQPDHGPVLGRRCDRSHAAARRITGHGNSPAT